jgi:hypothetical protein
VDIIAIPTTGCVAPYINSDALSGKFECKDASYLPNQMERAIFQYWIN